MNIIKWLFSNLDGIYLVISIVEALLSVALSVIELLPKIGNFPMIF